MVELLVSEVPFEGSILRDWTLPSRSCSYDGYGSRFVFVPRDASLWQYAIDVESKSEPAPDAIGVVLGRESMQRWGEIEITAKLTSVPVHLVLRLFLAGEFQGFIREKGVGFGRFDTETHWIVVGRRRKAV